MQRKWLLVAGLLLSTAVPAADPFQDCRHCPRMVSIPGGTFTMGSPADEHERLQFEGPRAGVAVADFAIGETEVTRGQYAVFVKATRRPPSARGCFRFGFSDVVYSSDVDAENTDPSASWRNPGFEQTNEHPVTCVSWQDARDYAAWLAKKTGKAYRLPSDAEFEYVLRAGTTSIFPWGTDEDGVCPHGNVGDPTLLRANSIIREQVETGLRKGELNLRVVSCEDGHAYTAPVASYRPNAFGLFDMTGNVWEYIADCWQESLPTSGEAYQQEGCDKRRVRGASWDDAVPELRSARRSRVKPDVQRNDGGFRVARDLTADEIDRHASRAFETPGQTQAATRLILQMHTGT